MRTNSWIILILLIIVGVLLWFLFAPPAFVQDYLGTATTTPETVNNGIGLNGNNTDTGITRGGNTPLSALVQVGTPAAGASVDNTFTISGQAPGNWFFEATFPVEIRDSAGNILLSTYVEAQSDWMTTNLVGYSRTVTVPNYTGSATVILRKSNASGLPEHDDHVSYQIAIQ